MAQGERQAASRLDQRVHVRPEEGLMIKDSEAAQNAEQRQSVLFSWRANRQDAITDIVHKSEPQLTKQIKILEGTRLVGHLKSEEGEGFSPITCSEVIVP